MCHKGHDIGYSRKSSFFCDCGAEVATAIEQNRTPCKCLTPVSEDTIRGLYETNELKKRTAESKVTKVDSQHRGPDIFTDLIAKNFSAECKESLEKLVEASKKAEWSQSILDLFNRCYQNTKPSPDAIDFSAVFSGTSPQPITGGSPNLQLRSGNKLFYHCFLSSNMLCRKLNEIPITKIITKK